MWFIETLIILFRVCPKSHYPLLALALREFRALGNRSFSSRFRMFGMDYFLFRFGKIKNPTLLRIYRRKRDAQIIEERQKDRVLKREQRKAEVKRRALALAQKSAIIQQISSVLLSNGSRLFLKIWKTIFLFVSS